MSKKITGLKRDNNEQYYTKENVSEFCVKITENHFKLDTFDIIVEPSAGTGSFIRAFEKIGDLKNVLSYDIDPKHETIIKQDFLTTTFESNKNILVIGNPPFGRQSSLAKKFIKHSCSFANVIAFILPRSFKKDSMTNCFDLFFHKIYETNLDDNSFIFNEKEYSVPCVFQIWEKKLCKRILPNKLTENDNYKIVKCDTDSTFAFRRVGVYAGKFIFQDLNTLSKESHYFIKSNAPMTNELIDSLNNLTWCHDNTIGPKSISKQELIYKLNKLFV